MKAKDLLAALQQLSASELELKVYAYTDHGQWMERVQRPSIVYFDPSEADMFATNKEDAKENGYKYKAILL